MLWGLVVLVYRWQIESDLYDRYRINNDRFPQVELISKYWLKKPVYTETSKRQHSNKMSESQGSAVKDKAVPTLGMIGGGQSASRSEIL